MKITLSALIIGIFSSSFSQQMRLDNWICIGKANQDGKIKCW